MKFLESEIKVAQFARSFGADWLTESHKRLGHRMEPLTDGEVGKTKSSPYHRIGIS